MASHRVTAVFATRAEAERVARVLVSELHIPYAAVDVSPVGREPPVRYDSSNLWDAAALRRFGSLPVGSLPVGSLFFTEEDRQAYLEELRRGRMRLTATVEESEVAHATHLLEHSGALSLYDDEHELKHEHGHESAREHEQRSHEPLVAATSPSPARVSESSAIVHEGTAPVVEERTAAVYVVGRRRQSRVRSYPVERPGVLHEEATRDTTRRTGIEVDDQGQPVPRL